jgi:hypothetical protein
MKFRFNATDTEGNMKISDPINPNQYYSNDDTFQVQKSAINITYIYGNATAASLTTSTEFGIQVYDLNNLSRIFSGYVTPTVKFGVTTNGPLTSLVMINSSSTNQSGHANVTFLPDTQFQQGNQTWYAYVESDNCYYDNNTENLTVTVNVNYPPYIENETVTGSIDSAISSITRGWGEGWSFNVTVNDPENDTVNVSLELDTGSGWELIEYQECSPCNTWTTLNFTKSLTCSYINSSTRIRFTAEDNSTPTNTNYTTIRTFNIEEEDITYQLIWGGYGNTSNRTSDLLNLSLHVRILDENTSYATPNTTMYITKVGTGGGASWDSGHSLTANSSGEVLYNFFPTCDNSSTPTVNEEYEVGVNGTSR